jgi:hypothetical protein
MEKSFLIPDKYRGERLTGRVLWRRGFRQVFIAAAGALYRGMGLGLREMQRCDMTFPRVLFLALLMAAPGLHAQNAWRDQLARALPLMGHRNWIVVGEPAFPLVNSTGIDVVATDLSQTDLLTAVLDAVLKARNVRPVFYTAEELPFVSEQDANGIGAYRAELATLLKGGVVVATLPHDQIMGNVEDVSRSYRVLVLKSTTTLPYTSVFIQLDSGYWTPDAEKRLRAAMQPR